MRQACARKPIAPAIFPPANSLYRKKLPPACPATTRGRNGAPGAIRTPDPQIRSLMLYPAELRVRGEAPSRGADRKSVVKVQSGSVREDPGGRRIIKKKQHKKQQPKQH